MTERLRLELSLVLPEVRDTRDACIRRLEAALRSLQGVVEAHVASGDGAAPMLCLHYQPDQVSLADVRRVVLQTGADISDRYGHGVLTLHAVDAEDAAARIEAALLGLPGVLAATVSLAAQRAFVEFDRERTSIESVQAALGRMGYRPAAPEGPDLGSWYGRNRELVWSLAAGMLLALGWTGVRLWGWSAPVATGLYAGSYIFGGFDLVRHMAATARQGRITFDIDLLMLVAAIGAAVLGEWAEGAFLLFLFALAHALEHFALGRARNAIRALAELAPATATVRRDGKLVDVPVEGVRPGETVLVRPGERIPVDGQVLSGQSAVNQAPITGESVPVEKAEGNEVFAGTVNGDGALVIETSRAVGDRTLDRVLQLVEEAQAQKAPTQRFTDRFERVFVPAVLLGCLAMILVPPLLWSWDWGTSFYRGMALLVASSPCALALGTPAAVLAGIAQAARKGVLVKGGAHLENLGRLRALALDKTGTLTIGRPEITDVMPADEVEPEQLLEVAAGVERHSQHPLALAVVREAERRKLQIPEAADVTSITARGIRASVTGEMVEIGNLRLWEELAIAVPSPVRDSVERLQALGRTTMVVKYGARWLGVLGVADRPREGVDGVLDQLRSLGIGPLVMLTGDNRGVGEAIGREVGVDEERAALLPEDKVAAIQTLLGQYGQVAMVGDGVNDAPALAHATVGIAMGGAGTAAALETADVALMGDDLSRLPFAVGLSRQARGIIRQNLYLSFAVIAVLVLATTTGTFGIGPAVLAHEGSSLVVVANALRLLGYHGSQKTGQK